MSSPTPPPIAPASSITLTQHLEDSGGRLPEAQALAVAHGIARGLAELHGRSLLYGTLHPDVVWLSLGAASDSPEVTLAAVDRARPFGALADCGTLHNLGAVYPTAPAHYLAPEYLSAGATVDGKADVYSLGALLYHLLGGRAPFEGDSVQALADAHLLKTPRPIRRRNPEVSDDTEGLLARLLAKAPALRPSMAQLLSLLPAATAPSLQPAAAQAVTVRAPAVDPPRSPLAPSRPPATEPIRPTAVGPKNPPPPSPRSRQPLAAGSRCGRYQIVRLLGGGGMAEVFEASHVQTRQRVAIKVPRPELLSNPSFAARFLVEARAMAQLQLGGTGEIYDFDQLPDGTPYIVMEYVAGECLRTRLQRCGSLPQSSACEIIRQIAQTMTQAHAAQVIHREPRAAKSPVAHSREPARTEGSRNAPISRV